MKTLFLASSLEDVIPLLAQFLRDDVSGKTVTFIPTASLYEDVNFYVDAAKVAFQQLGMIVDELDIASASPDMIRHSLVENDYIYVSGGNVFFLLQELKRTGTDNVIVELVKAGKPYIGESAGAMIVSPNIEYAKEMDEPSVAMNLPRYDALNLIDFYPIPHYTNYPFEDAAEAIIEAYRSQLTLYPITNFQAITVRDNKIDIVGIDSVGIEIDSVGIEIVGIDSVSEVVVAEK